MTLAPGILCGFTQAIVVADGTTPPTKASAPGVSGRYATTCAPPRFARTGFGGTPLEEAKSLLRPSLPGGFYAPGHDEWNYGKPLDELPPVLDSLIGRRTDLTEEQLRAWFETVGIDPDDTGGALDVPLPLARYFVIHDTSTPLYDDSKPPALSPVDFPASINTSAWAKNTPKKLAENKEAHVFIARTGISHTAFDYATAMSAVKYTQKTGNPFWSRDFERKFLHTELIQPRLHAAGKKTGDARAPDPGFPPAQLDRLAVVYIAASFRHDEWLVPAFHHNVDIGATKDGHAGAHDDPQNFDLDAWSAAIGRIVAAIKAAPPRRGDAIAGRGNTG